VDWKIGVRGTDCNLAAWPLCLPPGYEAPIPPVDDQLVHGPEMANRTWEVYGEVLDVKN
jgi:hypothetical protein